MKRRDALRELLKPAPATPLASTEPASASAREPQGERPAGSSVKREEPIKPGPLRSMGLTLKQMSVDADDARDLRAQLESGHHVVEIDPSLVEPSFVPDRIPFEGDPDFVDFVRSIDEGGQQVPILVRPHPDRPKHFQAAYGHRRLRAALELGRKVRAIIRPLSDEELVVAQGKENGDRRDLSFIERATFAAHLEEKGFARSVIMSALGVDKADLSRLLALGKAVPANIIAAIGPAPKAGRPRWTQLAEQLSSREDTTDVISEVLQSDRFAAAGSDQRFSMVLAATDNSARRNAGDYWRDAAGKPLVRIERSPSSTRIAIDERLAAGFGEFVLSRLPALHHEFSESRHEPPGSAPPRSEKRTGRTKGGASP